MNVVVIILVVTPRVLTLTKEEVAQFNGDGCTPDSGNIGSSVSASLSGSTTTITSNHVPNHVWQNVSMLNLCYSLVR